MQHRTRTPWPSLHTLSSFLQILQILLLVPTLVTAIPLSVFPRQNVAEPTIIPLTSGALCITPAPWTQILGFFLTNYIARIATFKKTSGYKGFRDYVKTCVSLFVPFIGISIAASTIARGSRFLGKDELGRALHAGTLVVVERDETWKPQHGEIIRGCEVVTEKRKKRRRRNSSRSERSRSRSQSRSRKEAVMKVLESDLKTLMAPEKWNILGQYHLPPGYALAKLPPGAGLRSMSNFSGEDRNDRIVLASSYNTVKSFAGVVQIVFSLYTIYGAYGFQIQRYGYAAFGFSVIPYTIMSFLNAIANLVEADYDALFLVESEVMLEANDREEAELFIGTVASLVPDESKAEESSECVDLLWKRDQRKGCWKVYEVDDYGEKIGRKWRVIEEKAEEEKEPQTPSHHHSLHPYARPPSSDGDCSIPERKLPGTQILIPAAGQYQTKHKIVKKSNKFYKWAVLSIITFSLLLPYIFIAIVSRFQARDSTPRQRLFMMGWLIVGQAIGLLDIAVATGKRKWWWKMFSTKTRIVVCFGAMAFAVGGFVEAGRMLSEFGYCIKI